MKCARRHGGFRVVDQPGGGLRRVRFPVCRTSYWNSHSSNPALRPPRSVIRVGRGVCAMTAGAAAAHVPEGSRPLRPCQARKAPPVGRILAPPSRRGRLVASRCRRVAGGATQAHRWFFGYRSAWIPGETLSQARVHQALICTRACDSRGERGVLVTAGARRYQRFGLCFRQSFLFRHVGTGLSFPPLDGKTGATSV